MTMQNAYGPSWFVSPWNFADHSAADRRRLVIHDTTLRDGEQQAGIVFSVDQKVRIASALDELGLDRIEAAMVAVSEDDRTAVRRIVESGPRAEIWTIARSLSGDVDMAIDCGVHGVGVILLGSEQYCKIFGWTLQQAIDKALAAAERARNGGLETSLLIADSPRLPMDQLELVIEQASGSGHFTSLALMDTFGTLSPEGTRRLIDTVRTMTGLPLEFHGHNDFGMATANAMAALCAGANIIHTSVLGLGERVGNSALEEVAVAARLLYGAESGIDLSKLTAVANLVMDETGISMAPHKAVVGRTITHIESGTVASEYVRWTAMGEDLQWLFPFVPSLVGGAEIELVLGKGSGMANVQAALDRLGLDIDNDDKRAVLAAVKSEASRIGRTLTLEEFQALVQRTAGNAVAAMPE